MLKVMVERIGIFRANTFGKFTNFYLEKESNSHKKNRKNYLGLTTLSPMKAASVCLVA